MKTTRRPQRLFGGSGASSIVISGARAFSLRDLYHFFIRGSWFRFIGAFIVAFIFINTSFAFMYWEAGGVVGVRPGSFSDAFFFSVQTLATIGYGSMTPNSLAAHLLVTCESMLGLLGMALVTGLAFAKFSRPKARVLFSNIATVSPRNGVPTLMFRVANERQNHVVEAQLRVAVLKTEKTLEGETLRRLYDLPLTRNTSPAFILSWTAMHPITQDSPLFGMDASTLKAEEAEILVTLLGIDDALSQTIHARHSYTAEDIIWGARLADILRILPDGRRQVDYSRFHDVVPVAK